MQNETKTARVVTRHEDLMPFDPAAYDHIDWTDLERAAFLEVEYAIANSDEPVEIRGYVANRLAMDIRAWRVINWTCTCSATCRGEGGSNCRWNNIERFIDWE